VTIRDDQGRSGKRLFPVEEIYMGFSGRAEKRVERANRPRTALVSYLLSQLSNVHAKDLDHFRPLESLLMIAERPAAFNRGLTRQSIGLSFERQKLISEKLSEGLFEKA
jgi:hypothetical protein